MEEVATQLRLIKQNNLPHRCHVNGHGGIGGHLIPNLKKKEHKYEDLARKKG